MARHTYDMGIVGNCAYVAHIDTCARVVWMCLPRFDSSSVFGHLLDHERGGQLAVEPVDASGAPGRQQYLWNTNVLETTIEAPDGGFRVTAGPPRYKHSGRSYKPLMLVRKLEPISGTPRIRVLC